MRRTIVFGCVAKNIYLVKETIECQKEPGHNNYKLMLREKKKGIVDCKLGKKCTITSFGS